MLLAFSVSAVERWGQHEIHLTGPASGNPYLDVQWSATFTQGDRAIVVPGFWDGGGTYRVRFSPPTPGEWRYETRSATPELNGKTGTFTATAPTGNNHGPVEVFDTFYLRYADGTPYHQFGTTCYAWVHQTRELQEQTLKTLAASPFNKIRFCVFPKSYDLQPERAGAVRLPEARRRQVRLQPARSGLLAALRAAHPRPAEAGHRGGPHPLASLRPLGLCRHERRARTTAICATASPAWAPSATSGGRWPTNTIS